MDRPSTSNKTPDPARFTGAIVVENGLLGIIAKQIRRGLYPRRPGQRLRILNTCARPDNEH